MFDNIGGFDKLKKEFEKLYDFYINFEENKKKGVRMPKNILLCGIPGCGKTLFIREFLSLFEDNPKYYIDGAEKLEDSISDIYKEARKNDKLSFVVIDELHLLIQSSPRLERVILSQLDGVKKNDNVITIMACNDFYNLPEAVTRKGRIDKCFEIGSPNSETVGIMVDFFVDKYKIKGDLDKDYLGGILGGCSCADLDYIFSELSYLGRDAKVEDVDNLLMELRGPLEFHVADRVCENKMTFHQIAVHEIGHAFIISLYRDDIKLYNASVNERFYSMGRCITFPKNPRDTSSQYFMATVDIDLGGYLASKIINKIVDVGSRDDLQKARQTVGMLVNYGGITGVDTILSERIGDSYRPCSPFRLYQNEKRQMRILRKRKRIVSKLIRKNKDKIISLANLLEEKKVLSGKEIYDYLDSASVK